MRFAALAALAAISVLAAPCRAQGASSRMHDSLDWGMWLGPLVLVALLGFSIAAVVVLVRWIGDDRGARGHGAHDVLDERYARGEIDREEYQRRRDDIARGS